MRSLHPDDEDHPQWDVRVRPRAAPVVHKFGSLTATALGVKVFEPVRYVIPGLLPEGLTLLAGKPKFGKSYAALDMCIAVATGGKALGTIRCDGGDVLYCALEDGERRLQDRLRAMLPLGDDMPERLFIETVANRLDGGLIDDLRGWIADHSGARLIVLDTLARIKPESSGKATLYDEDARGITPLHELTRDHPGVAVVIIHHTRKMEADDCFDTISGSTGLTGICDTLMVLARHGEGAKLSGQGRDIEGYEKALARNSVTGSWRITGDAKELAKTGERQALLDVLTEADGEALRTSTIAKAAGVSESSASHRLKSLLKEGLVAKAGYGKWNLLDPHQTSQSRQSGDDHGD
ncbi:MAG: AAA family ATPase [Acetobacteraceae bacterium]|nr:AAA family ATPase [Acetobacteraceae bacterium]